MGQLPACRRYNVAFQARLRREMAPLVNAGLARCARCGGPIRVGEAWDVGHVDGTERTVVRGPEHRLSKDCPKGETEPRPVIGTKGSGRENGEIRGVALVALAGRPEPGEALVADRMRRPLWGEVVKERLL